MKREQRGDWFWAAGNDDGPAGDRFVIVGDGQDSLWRRVRREISATEHDVAWNAFGVTPTIADCFNLWIEAREHYGANYNRVVLEMAQIPAFARWLRSRPHDLCNYVSNPVDLSPLSREPYDPEVEAVLRQMIASPA